MKSQNKSHFMVALRLAVLSIAMFGFGFLMVPLYDLICEVTGLNGKTGRLDAAEAAAIYEPDYNRKIRVEFSVSVNGKDAWEFGSAVPSMMVSPGESYTTNFVAKNLSDAAVIGQAIPSVAPSNASLYFHKTECFCFNEQKFEGNELKEMPVTFVIDPKLPPSVDVITLSYTFFNKS